MWHNWEFAYDNNHGFGILFDIPVDNTNIACRAFYEDGELCPADKSAGRDTEIRWLLSFDPSEQVRWYGARGSKKIKPEPLPEHYTVDFSLCAGGGLEAVIRGGTKQYTVNVPERVYRYYSNPMCSCGLPRCNHTAAVAEAAQKRIYLLMHEYVVTALPVDKELFLEPALEKAVLTFNCMELGEDQLKKITSIIELLDSACSDGYYSLFHNYILRLAPAYDAYDSKFLENLYEFMLVCLFENPGYRRAVLDPGTYAEKGEYYEDRQHRSNRAGFKRVLREYKRAVREMDSHGDYSQNTYKECLLKYRKDYPGLLRYYAEGKEMIDDFDIPFLEIIAEAPDIDIAYIPAVAEKIDQMDGREGSAPVFRRLLSRLSSAQRVETYGRLRHFTMPMEEIHALDVQDQRKMINNMPLSTGSIRYVMSTLLAGSSAQEKGQYLLRTTERIRYTGMKNLQNEVLKQAASLPDHGLLVRYIALHMRIDKLPPILEGKPDKEISTYFTCGYQMINEKSSFYVEYRVTDPADSDNGNGIISVEEKDGRLSAVWSCVKGISYPAELIRRLCLEGKEDEFRRDLEKNQDIVDAFLFEKKHKQFAGEYREFCETLMDEKLLLTETAKAGIDWLIYREDGSNALACKVGNTKKYVVKDVQEFVKAFRSGQTVEYGRDLILTHDTENLNEADAAVVKLLMNARMTRGRRSDRNNKRYVTVNDSLLGNMFEILEGRSILYNNVPCLLRLEPCKVRLRIDGRYALSSDLKHPAQSLLHLSGKGYLLTEEKDGSSFVIDRVDGAPEEISLIDLVERNPSVSIKPILKDFRKNIYSRFFELFDVDKRVQKDFALSLIRLNTYFDFEKSVITSRTVVLREDREIPADALTDRIDQVRYEALANYLKTLGFEEGILRDESRILSFFKLDFTRLRSLTNVYLSESLQNKELRSIGKSVIRVAYKNNLVSVFLEQSDFNEAELEQILSGLRKKKKYILLSGDRIVDLDSDGARDFGEAVKDFGMDPKDLYKKKTISMIDAIKAFSHEKSCRVDKYLRDMIEDIRAFKEADIALPDLRGELRPYQAEGFKWMSILSGYGMGGILADDMGLGKTIQVIALIRSDRARKPSLVVCPKSLVFNWMSEFARFDGKTQVTAIYGPDSRRSEIIAGINYKEKAVYITSYDSLRNDISRYDGEFNYGILDEAQYIKNVHAQKTRSVKELKVKHRFALTGTPIENSVVDLWSIFDYIMPGYFEELSRFRESDTSAIARKAAPFILRRVKEDVLEDLPPKFERILSAEMTDGQRKMYEAMRQDARKQLEEGGKAFDILPYLTRLRQICVDPGMFVENYTGGSGKLEMLSTLIPEYLQEHHRILIFSQFVKALEAVNAMLEKHGIPAYFLSGVTPAKERVEMMDSFNNNDSGVDIFLISLKAGGTGLNLTGADTVIHLDPWWNIAAENQASDRTHRIGQTRNVEVIRLIAGDSIEQRVVELQDIKREVIKQVISDSDGSVTSASLEDIAFVLE